MQSILKEQLAELKIILRAHRVKRAYAFGSVCTDRFNENSDIDLLVKFEDGMDPILYSDNYFDLLFSLKALFNRNVDLVSEGSLRNPYFIKAVNQSRQPIYE